MINTTTLTLRRTPKVIVACHHALGPVPLWKRVLLFSGWTHLLVPMLPNAGLLAHTSWKNLSYRSEMGCASFSTLHLMPSVQGGVVKDPE